MAKETKDTKEIKAPDAPGTDNPAAAGAVEIATKAAEAEKPKAVPKKTIKVLYVVAKREGFRRAGFAFGAERTRLVVEDLTAEQVKQLKEEPMLVVTETSEEV
ncbi:HI1506-related protein [Nitrosomonas oligotropha]|uniref:HI1506-related protein n=1 Tax=Nitrosomonas oligotropha TaxID=42354 RepID=UPI00136F3801|nr:HI1506-related protein [Nitrosomonas oligotropha]MXS82269.1 hypothetical protein [Nitrosomonas oligotropha]